MQAGQKIVSAEIKTENLAYVDVRLFTQNVLGNFDADAKRKAVEQDIKKLGEEIAGLNALEIYKKERHAAQNTLPVGYLFSNFAEYFGKKIDVGEMLQNDEICDYIEHAFVEVAQFCFYVKNNFVYLNEENKAVGNTLACHPDTLKYFFADKNSGSELGLFGLVFLEFFEFAVLPQGDFLFKGGAQHFAINYQFYNFDNPVDLAIALNLFWGAVLAIFTNIENGRKAYLKTLPITNQG